MRFRRYRSPPCILSAVVCLLASRATVPAAGAGLESAGNTDGVLVWTLGEIAPGATARETIVFAHDRSPDLVLSRLEAARAWAAAGLGAPPTSASASAPPPSSAPAPAPVWIDDGATDFALEGTCFFRWRLQRQALRSERGGQLSQFTWYLNWEDDAGAHRAGTPHDGDDPPENLRIAEPVRSIGGARAAGAVETADGGLRADVIAAMGAGAAAVEITVANRGRGPIRNVRLSAYANIESAHDEGNDMSFLDARTAGLLVWDPPTGTAVVMAGLRPPASGYSGTWNSLAWVREARGIPREEWRPFAGPSPELVRRMERETAAARGIYLPYRHESPATPETRALTAEEAEAALERDWTFQAMGKPWRERTIEEIGWARELAARLSGVPGAGDFGSDRAELDRLEARVGEPGAEGGLALYLDVRRAKRRIAFRNPVLDFSSILCIDQPMPSGPVNDIHESIHRMGITAVPGGRLLVVEALHPSAPVRKLAPDVPGSFWRPDLSFDGKRVLYCHKAHDEKSFALWEIGIDGSSPRRLTESDYDDIDPIYLPDGHILFTTTRGNSHVRCGPFIYSFILARCDADGGNIYLISCNGEPDFVPSLLDDGRVIYSRWEYTDKPLWRAQSLWTVHPDGTNTAVYWGNQSVWPDHLCQPRGIPGTRRVMFCGVGHHDWFSGSIGVLDPAEGLNYPLGLTKVTADLRWPESSLPPEDRPESPRYHAAGAYTGYQSPYPLSDRDFLVSARGGDGKFRLYLMDVDGNRELIWEGAHNVWHAIPVKERRPPPVIPDRVTWPGTGPDRKPAVPGVLFSPNVLEGIPDLPPGRARYVRVVQLDHKTYTTWRKTYRHSGPPVSIVQEDGVKRFLGTVPIEADGSVHFEVPAGRSLYFQLLDADGLCLQTMRSFAGAMPGERRGCLGCHEMHSRSAPAGSGAMLARAPSKLTPPPWGTESIGYERFVQPVLDRHCGSCHQGDGKARETLDLTLRPGRDIFKEPYLTLVGSAAWGNPVADRGQAGYGIAGAIPVESMDPSMNDPRAYATLRPLSFLSGTSPLIELARSGKHHDVRVEGADLERLIAWVDACCPWLGEEEIRAMDDPEFAGIEELPIRPRVRSAPIVERP